MLAPELYTELIKGGVTLLSVGLGAFGGLRGALNGMRESVKRSEIVLGEIRDLARDSRHDMKRLSEQQDRIVEDIADLAKK
jgi:hypothetical protein